MKLHQYNINLVGLANKVHEFDFEVSKKFFEHFKSDLFEWAEGNVHLVLDKRETMLIAKFELKGLVGLICDRSLEPFEYEIEGSQRIFFKYSQSYEEVNEEIINIPFGSEKLELAQLIYEFFALEVPLKRLHPDYMDEEDEDDDFDEPQLVYSVSTDDEIEEESINEVEEIDPRWQALKDLKK